MPTDNAILLMFGLLSISLALCLSCMFGYVLQIGIAVGQLNTKLTALLDAVNDREWMHEERTSKPDEDEDGEAECDDVEMSDDEIQAYQLCQQARETAEQQKEQERRADPTMGGMFKKSALQEGE
jgi:hypothetical protein